MEKPYLLKLQVKITLLPRNGNALSHPPTWLQSELGSQVSEIVILHSTRASIIVWSASVSATYVIWVATTKKPEETISAYHRHASLDIQSPEQNIELIDDDWFISEHEVTVV